MDCIELFQEFGWHATLYGATVISVDLIKKLPLEALYEKFRNTGFYYWYLIYLGLSKNNKKIVVMSDDGMYEVNPYKKTNSSFSPNGFARFWIKSWPMVIDALPSLYDPYKDSVCKMVGIQLNLYSTSGLLKLRMTKNLSYKILKEYKQNILKVTDVSLAKFYFITSIPISMVKGMRSLYQGVKKILRRSK